MIRIDGAAGEGGGQVLRSALTLSLLTRKPFEIDNVRARRKKPGLMAQHLQAVAAAAAVSEARVEGVITSYSIHYTKLYDVRGSERGGRSGQCGPC